MIHYRVTIRFGAPRQQYHVLDVHATSLREALRRSAELYPAEAEATGDLVEIRVQRDPESREYGPE
jgi:hypothetical protein